MKTEITFMGSGSAFTFANGQNNLLIDIETGLTNHRMLVDVGTEWRYMSLGQAYKPTVETMLKDGKAKTYREAVARINLDIATGVIPEGEPLGKLIGFLSTIDSIFITHIHADHASLELIGFLTRFVPSLKKLKLYGLAPVLRDLWDKTLSGGMDSLNYGQMTEEERTHRISLDSYFEPHYLSGNPEDAIKIGETAIEPFTTMHVSNRLKQVDSCGLLIKTGSGKEIMFTSDTQFCPRQLIDMYNTVDVIFHDFETSESPSGVHAHKNDMITLDDDIKAKTYPCHYQDGFDRSFATKNGFLKPVEMGDTFTYI